MPGRVTPPTIRSRGQGAAEPPAAFRINKAAPCQTNNIASVTTISGTRVTTISVPLSAPIAAPRSRTERTTGADWPTVALSISWAALALHTAIIEVRDRSMPPAITATGMPKVASAKGESARPSESGPDTPKSGWISFVANSSRASRAPRPRVQPLSNRNRVMLGPFRSGHRPPLAAWVHRHRRPRPCPPRGH